MFQTPYYPGWTREICCHNRGQPSELFEDVFYSIDILLGAHVRFNRWKKIPDTSFLPRRSFRAGAADRSAGPVDFLPLAGLPPPCGDPRRVHSP